MRSGRDRRLEEQMRAMNSKIDAMAEIFESRRVDDEAAAIAAERIRSGAADRKEDRAEALAQSGHQAPQWRTADSARWCAGYLCRGVLDDVRELTANPPEDDRSPWRKGRR
jgi:hypothetical protein